ncbi:hypothetical protein Patl1_02685 [Pistacia atlantica]|uniref:Uncharacterized protein n=1 Tax=Pistacia atlantica TaxID=434234 RepID=A0ACC1C830_9ROSI|nr:hypothetical protein Patl1_02685 [Pistacia atlantica]
MPLNHTSKEPTSSITTSQKPASLPSKSKL